MTAYTYNNSVPAASNNPSVDQPQMLINTQSIDSLLAVDHVSFNSSGSGPPNGSGGHHLQVTFDSKNAPGALTDPVSVLYTGNGTASIVSQMYYRNQNGIIPISALKAFGYFDSAGTLQNGSNLTVSSHPSTGVYNFAVPANILGSSNYTILISSTTSSTVPIGTHVVGNYSITSATVFQITFKSLSTANPVVDPTFFSVEVIQI